jgi:two-component system sensor histidine kinase VicK
MMSEEEIGKYDKFLNILEGTSKDSGDLINRLLHLATLKGETSKLDLDLHDLRFMIKALVAKMEETIDKKNLQLTFNFPDYSVEALLDVPLFEQVLTNLLSNAIKFTPDGGHISFTASYSGEDHILIVIKDTGIGIPHHHLVNLFGGISSFRRKGLAGEKSTGLGLYICQQIMRIHKGTIRAESIEKEGTSFIMQLPVPKPSSAYF